MRATDDDRKAYIHALAGEAPASHFLEIRYRVAEHTLATAFFPAHDADSVLAWVDAHARDTDVYVGCAPRCRQSGTKRDIEQVWVLWAECDGDEAARAALGYRPQPAIVVRSGSGQNVHAYWPLRGPVSPRDAEIANLRLAHAVGADKACFDAARILRPPGSWNHKHAPPAPVVALWVDTAARFNRDEVLSRAPEIDAAPIEHRWAARPTRDPGGDRLLSIPPAVYVSVLLGVDARPGRKVRCPFHDDERPSLHVYATASRGWSCYSCRRGGSIYDLASELWGMGTRGRDFLDLRRELEARFEVELSLDRRGIDR